MKKLSSDVKRLFRDTLLCVIESICLFKAAIFCLKTPPSVTLGALAPYIGILLLVAGFFMFLYSYHLVYRAGAKQAQEQK